MIDLHLATDTITPNINRRLQRLRDPRPVLEAMGAAIVSVAILAFRQAAIRPSPWQPVKRQGGVPLYDTGALRHSIRVISASSNSVTIGSDRPYAAAHQFGTRPYVITPKTAKALFWPGARHPVRKVNHPGLPARPFFPFDASGTITPEAPRRVQSAARAKLDP